MERRSYATALSLSAVLFTIILALGTVIAGATAINLQSLSTLVILVCLVVIFASAKAADAMQTGMMWSGFARCGVLVAWLLYGFVAAASVIVIGFIVAIVADRIIQPQNNDTLANHLTFAANSALSLLVLVGVYALLGGTWTAETAQLASNSDLLRLVVAVIASSVTGMLFMQLIYTISWQAFASEAKPFVTPEGVMMLAGLVVPLMIVETNLFIGLALLFVIELQIFRQSRVMRTQAQLNQRITELSSVNRLGASITAQLSVVSAIENIHHEICCLLEPTLLYVALYNADQDILEYRLVTVNNERVDWSHKHRLSRLQRHVLKTQTPLVGTPKTLSPVLFDDDTLPDAQYMLAPLMVSGKIIGLVGAQHATNEHAFTESNFELFQTLSSQAGLAIRNGTLYDRTVRLADHLALINQTMQDMVFNSDHYDALRAACEIAMTVTRADHAAVFLLSEQDDYHFDLAHSVGFETVPFPDGMVYRPQVYTNDQRIIPDVTTTEDKDIKQFAATGQFGAYAEMLLRSGSTTVGTLVISNQRPTYYDAPEINLLQMVADRITAAMDNTDLLRALELYAAEQAQLVHLSRISGGSLDLEKITYNICDMLTQMMNVSRASIGLWMPERNLLRFQTPTDVELELITHDIVVDAIPEFQRILERTSPSAVRIMYASDASISPEMQAHMQDIGDAVTVLIAMQVNGEKIGIISLGHGTSREFSDNDYRLLEMANHQISVQIHNARVHMATEQQLVKRLEQLGLIEEIAPQISQALDLDSVMASVLEAALQSTQADFVSFVLADRYKDEMFDIMWREVVGDQLVPSRFYDRIEAGRGNLWQVIQTRQEIIIPDHANDEHYLPPIGTTTSFRSSMMLPLMLGDEVAGVLALESRQPDFFTQAHLSFVRSLSAHAAISLGNARLLEQRKKQINILTSLRELSLDALSEIDPQAVRHAVLRTAMVLLEAQSAVLYSAEAHDETITLLDAIYDDNDHLLSAVPQIPLSVLQNAATKGTLQMVPDIADNTAYQAAYTHLADHPHKSLLVVPITRRQRVEELLCMTFAEPYQFTHDDWDTIDLLAAHAASHLENVALNLEITQQSDRTRAILDSTRDGIILLDLDMTIQDVNSAAVALTGVPLKQCLGQSLTNLPSMVTKETTPIWQEIVSKYAESSDSVHGKEFTIEHETSILQLRVLVSPVVDEEGTIAGRLLILRDITEEKELKEFHDTMQSMVLHDLRGPLTAIVTSMYVAENVVSIHEGELDETLLETIEVSLSSAEDMLRQVDTLRDLPMMTKLRVTPELVTVYEVAERAYNALRSNFESDNITVELAMSEYSLAYFDENLIQRVFVNLLHNAYKFTPENGHIKVELLDAEDQPDYWRVNVVDSGPGIPPEERERIFGQFMQVSGKKHRPRTGGKGTGLGLTFCKLAVEGHGGRIWVADEGSLQGACFSFTIPQTKMDLPNHSSTN